MTGLSLHNLFPSFFYLFLVSDYEAYERPVINHINKKIIIFHLYFHSPFNLYIRFHRVSEEAKHERHERAKEPDEVVSYEVGNNRSIISSVLV